MAGTYLLVLFKNYLFLAVPGLGCCRGFSQVAESRGCSLVVVCGFFSLLRFLLLHLLDSRVPGLH